MYPSTQPTPPASMFFVLNLIQNTKLLELLTSECMYVQLALFSPCSLFKLSMQLILQLLFVIIQALILL